MEAAVRGTVDRLGKAMREGEIEDAARRRAAAERFRRAVALGEYDGLFDEPVRRIMSEAARAKGVTDEIGALRFALARLVEQEEDPTKLALGVSRVANSTVRAPRTLHAMGEGGKSWDEFIDDVARRYDELQAEIESGEWDDGSNLPTGEEMMARNAEVMAEIEENPRTRGVTGYEEIVGLAERERPGDGGGEE